ncbi:MAG: KTSC domain-containing protein [Oscillospiraceae bacterium]|nr:KTSC domain-containing protein [Oscillospiraceae bacterium]
MKRVHIALTVLTLAFVVVITVLSIKGKTETYATSTGQTFTVQTERNETQKKTTSQGTPINDSFDWSRVSMEDTPESSCFSEIGYDKKHEVLVVTFRDSGASYAYYGLPSSVWNELCNAKSKGGYYNSEIKGYYDCEKLE